MGLLINTRTIFADTVRVYDYISKMPMCQAKYNSGGSSLMWVPKDVSRM